MSMFRTFRKNQKTWLTTLGVLAMFSFVFIPTFQHDGGSVGGGAKSKVVTTRLFGDLNEVDLHNLRVQRQTVVAFLDSLVQSCTLHFAELQEAAIQAGKSMEDSETMLQLQKSSQTVQMLQFFQQQLAAYSEESLVMEWLQARYAEQAGITVNDEMITQFMKTLVGDGVTSTMIQDSYKRIGLANPKTLDDALREMLLASEYRRQFEVSFQGLPLSRQWDYFCRVYRSATMNAAPVSVMDYVAKVADPSTEVLQAYFEQYKNTFADAFNGNPGFKTPKKVRLQYMAANVDKFADPASITPEAIRAEYERTKDFEFVKQPGEDAKLNTANPFAQGQENAPAPEEPTVTIPENAQPAESAPALPESIELNEPAPAPEAPAPAPAEEAKPAEPAPAPEAPAPAPAEETKPAEPAPAPEAPAPAPAEEAKPAEGAQVQRSPFRQVAFQGSVPPQPVAGGTNYTTQGEAPKVYIPLNEVEGRIRERLARASAVEKVQEVAKQAIAEMTAFDRAIRKYDAKVYRNEGKPIDEPKPTFDFAALANKYGFEMVDVPLVDTLELMSVPIGKSQCEQGAYTTFVLGTIPTYQPIQSFDAEYNVYISWKTEEVEASVPSFGDEGVKDRVLAAWKFEQARKPAKDEAERLAAECGKAGNLAACGDKVFETGPFHWLTYGPLPEMYHAYREPEISTVEKVDTDTRKNAGNEFMKTVFSLKEGETGVAEDISRSTYYVVQVKEFLPKADALQKIFMESPLDYYRTAANADLRAVAQSWLDQISTAAGLEWKRAPQEGRGE